MDPISVYKKWDFNHPSSEGLARLVSNLINPLFIPPAVIGLLSWLLGVGSQTIGWITSLSILFYTLVPLAGVFCLLQTGKISTPDLPKRKTRHGLYKISIASTAFASVCFFLIIPPGYQLITMVSLIFPVNILIGWGINRKWKISVHSAALSTAGAIFLYLPKVNNLLDSNARILSLIILLLLLLLMMWARYRLDIHTLAELFGGATIGFLLTFLQLIILINLW